MGTSTDVTTTLIWGKRMQEDMLLSADPNLQADEASAPPVGTIVDSRYKLLEIAGRGGMGIVYKAQHLHISHIVALKMLLKEASSEDHEFKRFQQEARAASLLKHPNIITIHDFGLHNNKLAYLAMDFLDGRSLFDDIHSTGGLPLDRFRHIFSQACDALGHAHKNGVVHRDIKPSNMLLVQRDQDPDFLVIVDFGLVKLTSEAGDQKLTSADMLVGSPLYMSPEQCRGQAIDQRTDIYSLGCVMYEALTAEPPHVGDSPLDTLYKHIAVAAAPMKEANSAVDVPPALEAAIFKAISKDPKDRQQSMQQLKEEIEAALSTQPAAAAPISNQQSTRVSQAFPAAAANYIKPRPPAPSPSGQFRTKQKTSMWVWAGPLLAVTVVFSVIIGGLVVQLVKADKSLSDGSKPPVSATVHQDEVAAVVATTASPSQHVGKPQTKPPAEHKESKASIIKKIAIFERQANAAYVLQNFQLARDKYLQSIALQQQVYGTNAKEEVSTTAMVIVCSDRLGDDDTAVEYLNSFTDLFRAYPNEIASDIPLLLSLDEISSRHGDNKLSILLIKAAINTHNHHTLIADFESFKLRFRLVDRWLAENNTDQAIGVLKEIYRLSGSDFPNIHRRAKDQLVRLLQDSGRNEEAQELQASARPNQPGFMGNSFWRGQRRSKPNGLFGQH